MASVIEQRVDRLEDLMAQVLQVTARTSRELAEFKDEMHGFKNEMRDFKDEMRGFKDEMRDFKDEMRDFKDEMHDFKVEMLDFKSEMRAATAAADARMAEHIERSERELREFKEQMLQSDKRIEALRKDLRRVEGEGVNRLGRLVEDIVGPGIPKIFRDITGLSADEIDFQAVRVRKKNPEAREFDAVAVGGGYVLINETKSALRPDDISRFYELMRHQIDAYFPEYSDYRFIGIVSSLYVADSLVRQASKLGLFALGFGEDLMDVLNPPDFRPVYFGCDADCDK